MTIIKLAGWMTNAAPHSPAAMLMGKYNYFTGWAATILIGLITLWYWRFGPDKRNRVSQ